MTNAPDKESDPFKPAHVHIPIPRMRRRRNRSVWTMAILVAAVVVGLLGYKWWTRPTTVVVAIAQNNVDDLKVMNAFSRLLGSGGREGLILRVQPMARLAEVTKAFLDQKVDLAVVRGDAELKGQGEAIALLRKNYAVIASLDPRIDEIAKVKGARIGVLGPTGVNEPLLDAILAAYEIGPDEVMRMPLQGAAALKAVEERQVDVVVAVAPIALGRAAETLRAILRNRKDDARLLPIDRAADVTRANPAFVEEELEKNAFVGLPAEPVNTVAIAAYIVARSQMSNDVAAGLARQFLSNRQAVIADAPGAAQIEAPSVEKDSFIRTHDGVANYINNEEMTFFDKYGDLVYIFMAVGGVFGSAAVAIRRSLGPEREEEACDLVDELVDLRRAARRFAVDASLEGADLARRWVDASDRFEEMLARALPLIGDASVDERTIQALATALTATERAIADLAPLALNGARTAPQAAPAPGA